ncbi:hypothetical protein [Streptomyces sp. SPB162]|uniref:hypothetical protein n=1 Tax=Streptomyces sp. SPB162 TaxID=2940560 RepID=UPI002407675F|nr:hypothetical protein [Streptomyces sp. SPB162]MDF9815503.1 hypothetical protein [Streptomyces sp. SPB162]
MAVQRNVVAASLVCAALVGGLTGCGGDTSDDAVIGSQVKPTVSASTKAPTGLDALTAKQVSDKAEAALTSVTAVKVDFAAVVDGKPVQLKASMSKAGECAGAMSQGKETMQFIGTHHTSYMKANDAFWRDTGETDDAAALRMLHGKWVKVPGDAAKDEDLAAFCDLDSFLENLTSEDDAEESYSKGAPTTVAGQPVVTVIEKKVRKGKSEKVTIYVAAQGEPYPLKLVMEDGESPGHVTFAEFDKPVRAVAPPASQTLDIAKLQDGGGKNV